MRGIQPSWVRDGGRPFCSRQECLNDNNQETIGLARVAGRVRFETTPTSARVKGGGSEVRAGTALEGKES